MKKKILVYGVLPPPYHGVAEMTKNILKALENSKYECFFINNHYSRSISEIGRNKLNKIIVFTKIIIKSIRTIRKQKIEWVYYPISTWKWSFIRDAVLLKILRCFAGPKIILHFHGVGIKDLYSKNIVFKKIVRHTLVNAKGYIVLGTRLKDDINMCIDNSLIQVVPNGIEKAECKNSFLLKDKQLGEARLLYLSNLMYSKGIDTAVESINILVKDYGCKNMLLTAAGKWIDTDTKLKIEKYIKANRLDSYIRFAGEKINKEKWDLFINSDIFIFPTRYESFGLVNLEAMQFGLPVITTNVGAIPEVIKDGINGFLVNPDDSRALADKIFLLINNEQLMGSIRENNIRDFNRFYTAQKFSKRFLKALDEIIK